MFTPFSARLPDVEETVQSKYHPNQQSHNLSFLAGTKQTKSTRQYEFGWKKWISKIDYTTFPEVFNTMQK